MNDFQYYRGNFIDDMKPEKLRAALKEVLAIYASHLRGMREELKKLMEDK